MKHHIARFYRTAVIAAIAFCFQSVPAGATLITLTTGYSWEVEQGPTISQLTFNFHNDAGDITENFFDWNLGIQIIPSGTVFGNVTPIFLTQGYAAAMPSGEGLYILDPEERTFPLGSTINGSSNFYAMYIQTPLVLDTLLGDTTYAMGTIGFAPSATAYGTWNIYAVQQGGPNYHSFWTDGDMGVHDFANLPSSAGDSSLLLGTITVIPEPGSLALAALGAGIVMYSIYARRKVLS